MFKTPYETTQLRAPIQDEWCLDVLPRLARLGLSKTMLARELNVNYTQLCRVLQGREIDPKMREKITAALDTMEAETA